MSENIRFGMLAGALFLLAYVGVAWFTGGMPTSPDVVARVAAYLPSAFPQSTDKPPKPIADKEPAARVAAEKTPPRKPAVEVKRTDGPAASQSDGDPARDRLRLAALQASKAYTAAPCDKTAKARLVDALGAYAKAWHDMMGCSAAGCDNKRLADSAAAFSTPLDMRVRDAIGTAFDKKGVSVDDFPEALRINVTMLARGRGDPVSSCAGMRAEGAARSTVQTR